MGGPIGEPLASEFDVPEPRIPQKPAYKLREVCQYTDTQPYVLRFWESEFPQLKPKKSSTGQPIYKRRDIELVLRIKQLLNEEQQTIASARKRLEREARGKAKTLRAARPKAVSRPGDPPEAPAIREAPAPGQESLAFDGVPRERYEGALEEIAHLKLELQETESRCRKLETAVHQAEQTARECERRSSRAVACIEELIERLS